MPNEDAKSPLNILLIENNEDDIEITLKAFEKTDGRNSVFVVTDGPDALDYLYNRGRFIEKEKYPKPDLILLDINMPKMSGFEFLERIKKDSHLDCLPVVMLTSSRNPEDIIHSYRNGAISYIQKAVSFEQFKEKIKQFNLYWQNVSELPNKQLFT